MGEESLAENAGYMLVMILPWVGWITFICVVYLTLRAPLRRQAQACLFLDLLQSGIREGRSPEQTIVEVADSEDRTLGRSFYTLAEHVRNGLRLGDALEHVPGFLPPHVVATLRVGEEASMLSPILAACRKTLTTGTSRSRNLINYLIVIFLLLSPASLGLPSFIEIVILPKLREVTGDYGGTFPPIFGFFYNYRFWFIGAQAAVFLAAIAACALYGRTIWFLRWLDPLVKPMADRVAWKLAWRRKQLLRDFSAVLATLLDANLTESRVVQLAAASTDNNVVIHFGEQILQKLQQGESLTNAMAVFDDGGEFRWRLANAAHGQSGFQTALAGWHEALDAKAFQQEQSASQVITTLMVIFNGAFVGLIVVGVFQLLLSIVWEVSLW